MRKPTRVPWLLLALALGLLGLTAAQTPVQTLARTAAPTPTGAGAVWLLELEGAIGPASADYLISSIRDAEQAKAQLFVIRLDTPGGLDGSMRDIIKVILGTRVPIATYVAPNGARAASAGTYILYASHIAAMAPATNVGSSTPVSLGGGSPLPLPGQEESEADEDAGTPEGERRPSSPGAQSPTERKVIEDAVAYIRGIAELRGRNAEWAELTVREAANLTASEALEKNVIDLIAKDLDQLLQQLDGWELTMDTGPLTLALTDAELVRLEPGWRYEFLALITDPNIAYILLMIGIYGLILEFYNPGVGVAGVTGVICLLLAAYALQMLPINYVGLALILVGIGLMVIEAFSPSFGVFGIGGAISFIFGSIILMDTDLPAYQISIPVIAAFAFATLALTLFAIGAALKARRGKVVSGVEAIVGAEATALSDFDGKGRVRAFGEIWQAKSTRPVKADTQVRITAVQGLVLIVEPLHD